MKDHVTLKTGENMLKIQHCHYRNKLHFKIRNISQYYCPYCILSNLFVRIRDQNIYKNLTLKF